MDKQKTNKEPELSAADVPAPRPNEPLALYRKRLRQALKKKRRGGITLCW